jgi:3-phosphoshikimate 1-carboxyvinyltransferase
MRVKFERPAIMKRSVIRLSGSKSECNRARVIRYLCNEPFAIENMASALDTDIIGRLLDALDTSSDDELVLDAGHAGTACRFIIGCAAYAMLAGRCKASSIIVTGTARMQKRPVGPLVEGLRQLGMQIDYLLNDGFPPLRIRPSVLCGNTVSVRADISSQFLTAMLLIAPCLPEGMRLRPEGKMSSEPYVNMTLQMMLQRGVDMHRSDDEIHVLPGGYHTSQLKTDVGGIPVFRVEGDWSAASYWYSFMVLSGMDEFELKGVYEGSMQGDSMMVDIANRFGVDTFFQEDGIVLRRSSRPLPEHFDFDYSHCPDLAQTLIVMCAALGIPGKHTGLESLRIKETDRIRALSNELRKTGVELTEGAGFMDLHHGITTETDIVLIDTYDDHRMAMAFAPLCMLIPGLMIDDPEVVVKSYPAFWTDMEKTGVKLVWDEIRQQD